MGFGVGLFLGGVGFLRGFWGCGVFGLFVSGY